MGRGKKEGKKIFVAYTHLKFQKAQKWPCSHSELRHEQCSKPNTSGLSILSLRQVNGVQALGFIYLTTILCIILFESK